MNRHTDRNQNVTLPQDNCSLPPTKHTCTEPRLERRKRIKHITFVWTKIRLGPGDSPDPADVNPQLTPTLILTLSCP